MLEKRPHNNIEENDSKNCTFKTESKSINMDLQNLLNHKTKVLGGLLSHASGGISEFVLDTAHKTQIHALEFMSSFFFIFFLLSSCLLLVT